MKLFEHKTHLHAPKNVNLLFEAEQAAAGINQKIAIVLTKIVGTMACAYVFTLLAIVGFPNLLGPNAAQYVQWISQTFIQLTMLSVIMVGQGLLGRKQELQAEESFQTTMKTYHDLEQAMEHLNAQDQELQKQTSMLLELVQKLATKP
jgi:cytochrome c biogenesis factor